MSTRSSSIFVRIRSLTDLKTNKRSSSEPSAFEGSSKDQCSLLWAPGKNGHASLASSQTVITQSKGSCRYRSRVLDSCPEMSTPISLIALRASGLTCVASVPALIASKRSPARCLSSPSAICERAELWVQRNRTLDRSPDSAAVTDHAALLGTRDQAVGGLTEQPACGLPVEGVEAPLPSPLLLHQSRVLELLHVVGDLRLAHAEVLLKLTDADTLIPLRRGHVGVGEVAATAALGHHGEHPHPYGVGEGAAQGYESLNPFHSAALADGVLLHDAELLGTHSVPPGRLAAPDEGAGKRDLRRSCDCHCSIAAATRGFRELLLVGVGDLHRDFLEARLPQQPLVLVLLQSSRDASAPCLHAPNQFGREPALVTQEHHVRDGEPASRLEDPQRLGDHLWLVRREVDDAVGDHHVHVILWQRYVLDVSLDELDVLHPSFCLVLLRQRKHLVGHVQPVSLAARGHSLGREQHVYAASAAQVQHVLTRRERGQCRGVAAPQRRRACCLGQPPELLCRVSAPGPVHT